MWESNVNPFENSFNYIQWGENTSLESTSYGIYDSSVPPYYIYSVTLEDLNPNTKGITIEFLKYIKILKFIILIPIQSVLMKKV